MRIVLFVNDSYFAACIASPVIDEARRHISQVVFSNRIRGSASAIYEIARKTHRRYFAHRVLVDLLTRANGLLGGHRSVHAMVKAARIPHMFVNDVNAPSFLRRLPPSDMAVTVNLDQIVKRSLLEKFPMGIVSFHASRLPQDKGISPVLWACARGDTEIWGALYRMDEGLDSGPIYEQFKMPVYERDTAFSLYERVCVEGGPQNPETAEPYAGRQPA